MGIEAAPRRAISVMLALYNCPHGATFNYLKVALGIRTESGVRKAVRAAKEFGLVSVTSTGHGAGVKSVVELTQAALAYCNKFFRREEANG
jgi:hypothetical protein